MASIRLCGTIIAVAFAFTLAACSSGDSSSITTGGSGTAALTWNGPTTNADSSGLSDLAGYRVYQSTTSGSYTSGPVATVAAGSASGGGTATTTVNNLASGTYYFVVRAYDSSGNESAGSNEVSKTIP